MKFIDDFRDPTLVHSLQEHIHTICHSDKTYRLMEFCGGHTHAIHRHGIADLLPSAIELVHGPGCPVCVLPIARLEQAIRLAVDQEVILCSYGDMLRVPAVGRRSLLSARAEGADIRMISSPMEVLTIAQQEPDRQVVFLAIGFETTTPPTAALLLAAEQANVSNLSVLCNHVITPAAITQVLRGPEVRDIESVRIDGFIGPAHVSTIIGWKPFSWFAEEFRKPVVVAGFEPTDVLQSIAMLVAQLNEGRHEVENQYKRAVTEEGNKLAQEMVARVMRLRPRFRWRGLGEVPYSAMKLRDEYADFDAELRFNLSDPDVKEHPACACPKIIRGAAKPTDCKLFGKGCTPEQPVGSCMVSSEGACAAWYRYRRRAIATA